MNRERKLLVLLKEYNFLLNKVHVKSKEIEDVLERGGYK